MAKRSLSRDDISSTEATNTTAQPHIARLLRARPPVTPPPLPNPPTATQSTTRDNGSGSQLDHEEHPKFSDVDQYVDRDLRTHRVYLPTDIFLNVLLGVPKNLDSNEDFQKIIESVLADPAYVAAREKYSSICRLDHIPLLYEDYVGMCNAASSVITKADSSPSELALWCRIQDSAHSADVKTKAKRNIQSCADDFSARPTKRSRKQEKLYGFDGDAVALPADLHPKDDADERHSVSTQCARYALETLSSGSFHTHSFGMLVGRNELQVLYYDRSVIAVCQPFKMFDTQLESGQDLHEQRFIAMLICQQRASLVQRGIMESLMPDPFLEVYSTYTAAVAKGQPFLLAKRQIRLLVTNKPVLLTLGRILMREPGIIGRNTCVLEATSPEWEGLELIVKISWPPSSRVAENVFIDSIVKAVADAGDDAAWVPDHIPNLLHSQDFPLSEDTPGTRLRDYFADASTFAADKRFDYETRVCRVSVHERLYPVEQLTSTLQVAQVLFDVLQVHRWIYDHPRIIHRDMSIGNIMWHRRRGRICGVLNDFDLSSFRDSAGPPSKQRTGTRPFMAHELHKVDTYGHPPHHIYRHDLESLFYITTMLSCGYELQHGAPASDDPLRPNEGSPCLSWISLTHENLYTTKREMFFDHKLIPKPHRSFFQFRPWLLHMHGQFYQGVIQRNFVKSAAYAARIRRDMERLEAESDDDYLVEEDSDEEEQESSSRRSTSEAPGVESFDETTLGGFVTYAAFFKIMRTFGRHKRRRKNGIKITTTALDVMYPEAKED
ncbi:hypothetical protein CPB85DRAFT_1439862 [Mucidula mucida]|nr:hypothetical protein CPB85DRAFT_1439862 [Mucidula mucida]